ncbi:hypothetical protein [Loktanella sp. Alg231-35]|nr:hypothetical protein [Loktanella sp. Alg231-35]
MENEKHQGHRCHHPHPLFGLGVAGVIVLVAAIIFFAFFGAG